MTFKRLGAKLTVALLTGACFVSGQDVITSLTDGTTPAAIAPGAPAGSYPLSGFDNINLFSGNLSMAIPLLHMGGRGEAGFTITLRNERNWMLNSTTFYLGYQQYRSGWPCSNPTGCGPFVETGADPTWWAPNDAGYGPGVMFSRTGASGTWDPICPVLPLKRLLRLTFIEPDGTEHEFRDTTASGDASTSGQPDTTPTPSQPGCQVAAGKNRGKLFTTFDGSAMTFVSDGVVEAANSRNDLCEFDRTHEIVEAAKA